MVLIINTNKLLMNKNLMPYIYMNFCREKNHYAACTCYFKRLLFQNKIKA